MCELEFSHKEEVLYVYLKGEIDHHSAKKITQKIDSELLCMSPKRCILDFSGVGFMDSSGIGLILGRHKLLVSGHSQLVVQGVPRQVEKVLALAGIFRAIEYSGGKLS